MYDYHLLTKYIKFLAPPFYSLFNEFKNDSDGWLIWPPRLLAAKQSLKFDDYVNLYNDENSINGYFINLLNEVNSFSRNEQLGDQYFHALTQAMISKYEGDFINGFCEDLDLAEIQAQATLEVLGIQNQIEDSKNESAFFAFIIAHIFNLFSVMVNGQKLTYLVPKAVTGDDDCFIRAIKIDRNLLVAHPYFKNRFEIAQCTGEIRFIKKISNTIASPHLKGKIKNSGLYFIFSLLDIFKILDKFTHSEILELYQNVSLHSPNHEIYDTSTISKHLKTYRKLQS